MDDIRMGEVAAIINDNFLILKLDRENSYLTNEDFMVYGEVSSEELKTLGLHTVRYPKGEVTVIAKQSDTMYLASVIKTKSETRTIRKNSALAQGAFSSTLNALLGTPEETVVEVPVREKALLNREQSLGILLEKSIKVGDKFTTRGLL